MVVREVDALTVHIEVNMFNGEMTSLWINMEIEIVRFMVIFVQLSDGYFILCDDAYIIVKIYNE